MTTTNKDILIIGGGIIGASCAYELSKAGAKVTLIDKGEPGFGCSYGNAGWITPCFAMPLPQPGMILKSIGWMLDPDSPFYIKPELSITLFKWLTRFLLNTHQAQFLRSVEILVSLSHYSLDAYKHLATESNNSFGFTEKGLLMVAQSDSGLKATLHEMDTVAKFGVPGTKMSEDEIRATEPALVGRLKGGVYFTKEAHAEPLLTVEAMIAAAKKMGAEVLSKTEAYDFEFENNRITKVHTTRGSFTANTVVLATGPWSPQVAKRLRVRTPILGGKGYALSVAPFDPSPKIPIMVLEKKLAVTPRANAVRLAGTLELVNNDDSITARRVRAILKSAQAVMNVPQSPQIHELWRGLRPCTPDGVPMIGFTKNVSNLMIVAGHQMLGLQSAAGSGRLAADLIMNRQPLVNPKPFDPNRF